MQVKKLGYVLFVGVIAAVCILPAAVMPWQEENAVGNPCTFNWIETNRVMSDSEVENANVACAESVTIQKGTMYQMVNGTVDGWISDIGGVVFCAK